MDHDVPHDGAADRAAEQGASRTSEADLFMALFDKNGALSLKRVMAEQFEDLEGAISAFEGPGGSTLITERNKVALKVLAEQIAAGKTRIGIFTARGTCPTWRHAAKRSGCRARCRTLAHGLGPAV